MKHKYLTEGITCMGCVNKVSAALSEITGITNVEVSLENKGANITMSEHVATQLMNEKLAQVGNYRLVETPVMKPLEAEEASKPFIETYKPLLIVLTYLLGAVALQQLVLQSWNGSVAMQMFMGGFFVVFSFFKMLDLKGFAMSYSSYDIIAKRWLGYGYIYPFIELGLGIAYVANIAPLVTNSITLVVMSISIIGVLQSVLNKRKIQCACLGTGFNLPMSTVTIIEDGTMIVMAAIMIGVQYF